MALHEQCVGASDEWYTPAHVFEAMGAFFDLDVANPTPKPLPWIPAERAINADSLARPWSGFVWMNPPFGGRNGLVPWLGKFFAHGNGVALVPDRTSAPWWQDYAPRADLALQVRGKLKFLDAQLRPGESPAQGTTLLALGEFGVAALERAARAGLGSLWRPIQTAPPLGSSEAEDRLAPGSPPPNPHEA